MYVFSAKYPSLEILNEREATDWSDFETRDWCPIMRSSPDNLLCRCFADDWLTSTYNTVVYVDEEASDKEVSVESDEEKSTEDEETSESETVSGSPSESEVRYVSLIFVTHYCL